MIVVDASVAVKWFAPEPGQAEAECLLDTEELLIAPAHCLVEVGRALLRHLREQSLTPKQCSLSYQCMQEWMTLIPTEELAEDAFILAYQAHISIYDALYVAAAQRYDSKVVTADKRLVEGLAGSLWEKRVSLLVVGSPSQ